jgi:hypothetical protein
MEAVQNQIDIANNGDKTNFEKYTTEKSQEKYRKSLH